MPPTEIELAPLSRMNAWGTRACRIVSNFRRLCAGQRRQARVPVEYLIVGGKITGCVPPQ
jgi:hypothetical protein